MALGMSLAPHLGMQVVKVANDFARNEVGWEAGILLANLKKAQ